jgi:hypothetical protein
VTYVTNPFQIDAPSIASFSILLAMSGVTLALSILFHLKSRAVKRLPKALKASIFSRTFNVFNPFPEKRRTFHSYLFFLIFSPLVAFSWTFFLVFIVLMKVFQAGLIMGFVLFVVCLNLMMTSEAFEIYANISKLLNAARSGTSLGRGDMVVLYFTKKSLTKLSAYYLVLTGLFTASFFAAPYVFPMFLLAFANFVGAITAATASTLFLAPIFAVFLFSIVAMTVFILARKLRALVFDFPPSGALTSAGSANARMKLLYERRYEAMEADPGEMTW